MSPCLDKLLMPGDFDPGSARCAAIRDDNGEPLQNLHIPRADDDLFLAEHGFQTPAVMPPPCPVEGWRHDLEHHDVVAVGLAFALPQAVRGRAGERRQPAEALAELAAHLRIEFLTERSADVVIQRKQDLNELHDITSTAAAAAAAPAG